MDIELIDRMITSASNTIKHRRNDNLGWLIMKLKDLFKLHKTIFSCKTYVNKHTSRIVCDRYDEWGKYLNFNYDVSLMEFAAFQNDFIRLEFLSDNGEFTVIRSPIQRNDNVLGILPG